ncbi:MAG: hypothetical protein AAF135_13200 [Bacteroidota bacterium]
MPRYLLFLALFLSFTLSTQAKQIFEGFDFSQGEWAIIGVPLHNYHKLPIQEELGTFIVTDTRFMSSLQQSWDFAMTFDDKCDHHYALKVYRNGELVESMSLNLFCGYVSINGLSYQFDPAEFDQFKQNARQIPWSRISFSDPGTLKSAIQKLDATPDVYWYQDVSQYEYTGYFMLNIDNLPWDTDRDSLQQVVRQKIAQRTQTNDFHLAEHFHIVEGEKLGIRYLVNCDQGLAQQLVRYQYLPWRTHLSSSKDAVYILALGIDEDRFRRLMK